MTNIEKYNKVFGLKADKDACPPQWQRACIQRMAQGDKTFGRCKQCKEWWNKEYKEDLFMDVKEG